MILPQMHHLVRIHVRFQGPDVEDHRDDSHYQVQPASTLFLGDQCYDNWSHSLYR